MIRSMTGYGRGENILYNRKFIVEIKSVNHRYSDIKIKMPNILNCFEDKIKKIVSKEIFRGKVDIFISFQSFSKDDLKINFNEVLADAYVFEIEKIKLRYGIFDFDLLSSILAFPEIISVENLLTNDDSLSKMWECLENSLNIALYDFLNMRTVEGNALKIDLESKLLFIKEETDTITEITPTICKGIREKLLSRLTEILESVTIDENRLLTEVTLLADKACIDEELTRLYSHINQMGCILNEKGAVGRKLDFLVQEMNREVNTISSKSNDINITKIVIDLKSEIEKIREQVQNIE